MWYNFDMTANPNPLPHDFSPLTVATVVDAVGRREFSIRPALRLFPKSDDESRGELLVVEEPSLNITACAATRMELEDELNATLIFLWDEYAVADDQMLTTDARDLKAALRARMTVQGLH